MKRLWTTIGFAVTFCGFANAQIGDIGPPIIFVHGWCGGADGWENARNTLFDSINLEHPELYPRIASGPNYDVFYDGSKVGFLATTSVDPSQALSAVPPEARFFSVAFYSEAAPAGYHFDGSWVADVSINHKAFELSKIIARVKELTHSPQVILITHSMGGLDSRAYIEGMAASSSSENLSVDPIYENDVASLVTLDTPHNGTSAAYTQFKDIPACFALNTLTKSEMAPDSDFLNKLNYRSDRPSDLPPPPFRLVSIIDTKKSMPDVGDLVVGAPSQDAGFALSGITFDKPVDLKSVTNFYVPQTKLSICYLIFHFVDCLGSDPGVIEDLKENIRPFVPLRNTLKISPGALIVRPSGEATQFTATDPNNESVDVIWATYSNVPIRSWITADGHFSPPLDSADFLLFAISKQTRTDFGVSHIIVHQTIGPPAPLAAPANLHPSSNIGSPATVTFTWNAVASATGYRLRIATDPSLLALGSDTCSDCLKDMLTAANSYSLSSQYFASGKTYYWTVHAAAADTTGSWADQAAFSLTAPTATCGNGDSQSYLVNSSPPVHPNGTFVKTSADSTVYLIRPADNHLAVLHRDGIANPATLQHPYATQSNDKQFDFQNVITVSDGEMANYPIGGTLSAASTLAASGRIYQDGTLIRKGGEISVVTDGGSRRPFATESAFLGMGYLYCNVKDDSTYDSYPAGAIVDGTDGSNRDFSLTGEVVSQTVAPGGSAVFRIQTTTLTGTIQDVNFNLNNLPSGTSVSYNSNPVASGTLAIVTVPTSVSTNPDTYSLQLQAGNGNFIHSLSLTLIVKAPDLDFSITVPAPNYRRVSPGTSATWPVQSTIVSGTSQLITFDVLASSLPAGVTYNFSPAAIFAGETTYLTVNTPAGIGDSSIQPNIGATYNSVVRRTSAYLYTDTNVKLDSFSIPIFELVGTQSVYGHLQLTGTAPLGGATIALQSDHPELLSLPASITIPEGATQTTFVATGAGTDVATRTVIAVTASYKGDSVVQGVVVNPEPSDFTLEMKNTAVPGQEAVYPGDAQYFELITTSLGSIHYIYPTTIHSRTGDGSLPFGMSYKIPNSMESGDDANIEISTLGTTPPGTYDLELVANDGTNTHIADFALTVLNGAPLFGLLDSDETLFDFGDISKTAFGSQLIGYKSASKKYFVWNRGGAPMQIDSIIAPPQFTVENLCPKQIDVAEHCPFVLSFAPTTLGYTYGDVVFNTNAIGAPESIELNGTGIDFQISLSRPIRPRRSQDNNSALKSSAEFSIALSPSPGFGGTVYLSCEGAPPGFLCSSSTPSVALHSPDKTEVVFEIAPVGTKRLARRQGIGGIRFQRLNSIGESDFSVRVRASSNGIQKVIVIPVSLR